MKKLLLLLFTLLASPAYAGVSCSLPFNLQNGTTADATQVMANYNALVTCLSNAAAAGVNNDITALTALTTPITPAQGGTPVFTGGISTGSANSQVISGVSPASFGLTGGNQVTFIAGFSNTGPTQINVAGSGLTNVYRRTQLGIMPMVGGEIVANHVQTVEFDGAQFQLLTSGIDIIGEIKDFAGPTAPAGWNVIDGSCQLRAGVFAALFSLIGTTYDPTGSTCDVAHFAMPDGRGRMLAGADNMGGIAANRITAAVSGCVGTTLGGAGCGTQSTTIFQTHLPAVNLSYNQTTLGSSSNRGDAGNLANVVSGLSITATPIPLGGSGAALPTLNPLQIVNKVIKY